MKLHPYITRQLKVGAVRFSGGYLQAGRLGRDLGLQVVRHGERTAVSAPSRPGIWYFLGEGDYVVVEEETLYVTVMDHDEFHRRYALDVD